MKTYIDCIPCFLEQALKVSRFVCDDEQVHEQILRDVLQERGQWPLEVEA